MEIGDMHLYRHIGNQIGTIEARDLAEQLVAWHDAMVRHLRVAGVRRADACDEDCPHEDASALWSAAQEVFGERAAGLVFLSAHGRAAAPHKPHVRAQGLSAEASSLAQPWGLGPEP
jgi:hypothetical protein